MSAFTGFGWYGFSVESGIGSAGCSDSGLGCTPTTCGNIHDPSPYWTSQPQFTHYQPFAGFINSGGLGDIGLRDFNNGVFYYRRGTGGGVFCCEVSYLWAAGAHYQPFTERFDLGACGDIGLRDPNNGVFYIRYGDCGSGFSNETQYPWAAGYHYKALACNVNGDSYPDIGLRDPNNGVFYFHYGDGTGQFNLGQVQYTWAVGAHYQPFARDFDDDGLCDIGLRDPNNGVFYILYGNGNGTFSGQTVYPRALGYHYAPFAIRVDTSGYLGDIGLKDPNNGVWYVRYGNGTGSFCCETSYPWAPG